MANETTVTVIKTLVGDSELRYTTAGTPKLRNLKRNV